VRAETRWAWAEIDLDAIAHNVRVIRERVTPAAVWAVVKADGYGHGAVDVARAAVGAGAEGLCVALVAEGIELRQAGIDSPILLLSEQPPVTAGHIVAHRLTPTVYTLDYLDALAAAGGAGLPVHLKIDTGMQRVGAHHHASPALAAAIEERAPRLRLAGIWTHLATADDPTSDVTREQLAVFDAALSHLPSVPAVHAANSAGALAWPDAHRSLVRAGIAIYGISPGMGVDHLCGDLRPAMTVRAMVSHVKQVRAGSRISYGHHHEFRSDTTVATVPIGYADGVPRRLFETGGEVLIGGRRRPIVGAITMDQLMVDCGDADIRVGDDVVLIGEQTVDRFGEHRTERIRAEDWAARLGTIGYEIVCGISKRVPRVPRRSIES
jgi:alanine racemase